MTRHYSALMEDKIIQGLKGVIGQRKILEDKISQGYQVSCFAFHLIFEIFGGNVNIFIWAKLQKK